MKKLFCLICLIFITGCNAEYTLVIDGDEYNDKLFLYDSQSSLSEAIKKDDTSMDVVIAAIRRNKPHYKERLFTESLERTGYEYTDSGLVEELESNTIVSLFYDDVDVTEEDGVLTLETSSVINFNEYRAPLENVSIKIVTNRKLIETNAHNSYDNTYVWDFQSGDLGEDVDNKIYIKLGEVKRTINYHIIILVVSLLLICGCVILYNKVKNKLG